LFRRLALAGVGEVAASVAAQGIVARR